MILAKRSAQAVLLFVYASSIGITQTTTTVPTVVTLDKYTPEELSQRAAKLKVTADKSGGAASEVLVKYPGHFTMLGFRDRTGGAELHRDYADIDVVVDGSATLITGGTMVDPKTPADGEVRSPSIQGGQSVPIHKGDILHIPANTPHQMLIPAGGSLTYFVIKASEPSTQH